MTHFSANSLATLQLSLHWKEADTQFTDRIVARRVNAWRDIFPPRLQEMLTGHREGDSIRYDLSPGELVPCACPQDCIQLPRKYFPAKLGERKIMPELGRFYPQALLCAHTKAHPCTLTPVRVARITDSHIVFDKRHPLADRPISIEATILQLQNKRSDTGGQLFHWGEEIANNGPGMQAPLPNIATSFTTQNFFACSHTNDPLFYRKPRIIGHIDKQAHVNLTQIYSRFIQPGMRILDLMSSVESHLPNIPDIEVTGIGMNKEEMEHNPQLTHQIVHDLNADTTLPAGLGQFDIALCSLSIEYLRDPVAVLRNVRKHLAPQGTLLISFSNRWFPEKVIMGWLELHEFERIGLVHQFMQEAGFSGPSGAETIRNDWRPYDDPHFRQTRGISDPIFAVWSS